MENDNIRFKVVKENRMSIMVSAIPFLGKTYTKGIIVMASIGTSGIMVFKKREQAEKFIKEMRLHPGTTKIIKVRAFGNPSKEIRICPIWWLTDVNRFSTQSLIQNEEPRTAKELPSHLQGTECYEKVKVLD